MLWQGITFAQDDCRSGQGNSHELLSKLYSLFYCLYRDNDCTLLPWLRRDLQCYITYQPQCAIRTNKDFREIIASDVFNNRSPGTNNPSIRESHSHTQYLVA